MTSKSNQLDFIEEEFDPTVFGFDTSFNGTSARGRRSSGKDYVRFVKAKDKKYGRQAVLSLSADTSEFVIELIGKTVNFAIDGKGRIVLYKGKSRVVSKSHKTSRHSVAIATATDRLDSLYGKHTVVYLKASLYAKGEALLLTPTGEVE